MTTLFKKWFWKAGVLFLAATAAEAAFAATTPVPIDCPQSTLTLDGRPSAGITCYVPNGIRSYGWDSGRAYCDDHTWPRDTVNLDAFFNISCEFRTPGLHAVRLRLETDRGEIGIFEKTIQVNFCTPNIRNGSCTVTPQNNPAATNLNQLCTAGHMICDADGTNWLTTADGRYKCFVETTRLAVVVPGGDAVPVPIPCDDQSNPCVTPGTCQEDGSCSASSPKPENTIILSGSVGMVCCQNTARFCGAQETCNACDDDCDELVDESPVDVGKACNNGLNGACNRTGQMICEAGQIKCDAASVTVGVETCNNLDDDCDGIVDNNLNDSRLNQICSPSPPIGDCKTAVTTCTAGTVACSNIQDKQNGEICNDQDICTIGDTCQKGVCTGAPRNCDDSNPCTTDRCSAKVANSPDGCYHTPLNGALCNDKNACTTGENCQAGVCGLPKQTKSCPAASDACHVSGICNNQTGLCSAETEIGGKPTPNACQDVICSAKGWDLADKPTKLKEDKCHTLQCSDSGWTLVEKPECVVKASTLPEASKASSKIFDVAKRTDDPDSDNKTCTVLLNSFDGVTGSALFYPNDFKKQFLIVTGKDSAGVGKLALIPPKAMGELGDNCQDLGSKIQYRDLAKGPLLMPAATQVSGKNALIGVTGLEYCYYPNIDQILQPATLLPEPIFFPTDEAGNATRIWQSAGAGQEFCDISKIDSFKGFSFGNTFYLVGGVECGSESGNVAGLDICNKTAEEERFQCSFIMLQKLSAQEKVTHFRLAASDREGKFYAILATKEGNNLSKKLIEVRKEASGWSPVAQDISEIPGVIVSKDKIKRDLPASEAGGGKIFITESGEVQEMKEEAAQSRVERHERVHGTFVDAKETADARFAPDDNAWNVYGDKNCGIMGEQITLDANNNPVVTVLKEENLTADSSRNNMLNDPMLRLCHPKYLVPLTRKNYGGTDMASVFEVFDTSNADNPRAAGFALSFFFNINEKPKVEPKSSAWDGNSGAVKFEASDAAHDALKNAVQSFKDASGNDISCWVDKIEETQVLFTKKGPCRSGASNITLNALPPAVSTAHSLSAAKAVDSGVGKEPLTMVVCASDPGNASGCTDFQLSKAVAVVEGVAEIPGEVAVAVTEETATGTPMGYKISGGCSLVKGNESNDVIGYILLMVFALSLIFLRTHLRTPLVDKIKKNMM